MSSTVNLHITKHPHRNFLERYDRLIGIDQQKDSLLSSLAITFQPKSINSWLTRYHPNGIPFGLKTSFRSNLIILSGDVGCGKTELALTIGSKLSNEIGNETIMTFLAPSSLRGSGLVGELESRIHAAFSEAKRLVPEGQYGIIVFDEGDSIATSRSQLQAHHEDRAGVNAFIQEIDLLERENEPLVAILISNRSDVLDPAVLRRARPNISFVRPDESIIRKIFQAGEKELGLTEIQLNALTKACSLKNPLFSYSDIFKRILEISILRAAKLNKKLSYDILMDTITLTTPSPIF